MSFRTGRRRAAHRPLPSSLPSPRIPLSRFPWVEDDDGAHCDGDDDDGDEDDDDDDHTNEHALAVKCATCFSYERCACDDNVLSVVIHAAVYTNACVYNACARQRARAQCMGVRIVVVQ